MHIGHCHLIFTSEKLAIRSVRNAHILWLTIPNHIHLHHPVLEPVPVISLQSSSRHQQCDQPVPGHPRTPLTSLLVPPGHWGVSPGPGLALLPHPISLLQSHLIAPEPVLVKSCEAVDHNRQRQSQEKDADQGTQPGKQLAQCGLKWNGDYHSSSQCISCFLPLDYSPAPLWWWSSGTRGSCPGRSRSCSGSLLGRDLPAPPRTCRQCWQNIAPRPLKHCQTDLLKFRRFCLFTLTYNVEQKS